MGEIAPQASPLIAAIGHGTTVPKRAEFFQL
jgi:hypothetical protein